MQGALREDAARVVLADARAARSVLDNVLFGVKPYEPVTLAAAGAWDVRAPG